MAPTTASRGEEREHLELRRVEHGDDDDGADVVDDGQGQQEHLDRRHDAAPEQAEHADRHGDVGGHRDAPPVLPGTAHVEAEVDQCRYDHPAKRGECWRCRLAAIAQLALDQLALDLQADDEEEQRHQAVVDPLLEREVERQLGVPQVEVRGRPRGVRPQQGNQRRSDEDHPTGGLRVQEVAQRLQHCSAGGT